jgi:cysteinyl-tRNA synthetase
MVRFSERMDDDLDTPGATALLFDLVRRANAADDVPAASAALAIADAVGLALRVTGGEVGDDASALARRRDEARGARDWKTADALRDELAALGYEVADTPVGTKLHRR